MLCVGPWSRLPLTVRWLEEEFAQSYSDRLTPPLHMPITYGKVTSKKPKEAVASKNSNKKQVGKLENCSSDVKSEEICSVCSTSLLEDDKITCLKPDCSMISHIICLAEHFCKDDDMVLPVEGNCPLCKSNLLWGDLIRKKIGCNMHLDDDAEYSDNDDEDDFYNSED